MSSTLRRLRATLIIWGAVSALIVVAAGSAIWLMMRS